MCENNDHLFDRRGLLDQYVTLILAHGRISQLRKYQNIFSGVNKIFLTRLA